MCWQSAYRQVGLTPISPPHKIKTCPFYTKPCQLVPLSGLNKTELTCSTALQCGQWVEMSYLYSFNLYKNLCTDSMFTAQFWCQVTREIKSLQPPATYLTQHSIERQFSPPDYRDLNCGDREMLLSLDSLSRCVNFSKTAAGLSHIFLHSIDLLHNISAQITTSLFSKM